MTLRLSVANLVTLLPLVGRSKTTPRREPAVLRGWRARRPRSLLPWHSLRDIIRQLLEGLGHNHSVCSRHISNIGCPLGVYQLNELLERYCETLEMDENFCNPKAQIVLGWLVPKGVSC